MKPLPPAAIFTYDGTFEGFLSAVFQAYRDKVQPLSFIDRQNSFQGTFEEMNHAETDNVQAQRVRDGIVKRSGYKNLRLIHVAFLSNDDNAPMLIWRYLQKLFRDDTGTYHHNLLDEDVYGLVQMARQVRREVHRFHGFIRFQLSNEGMYFAPIDPDNDIVRLLAPHFKSRFADQEWVIYDVRRKYGIWYDKQKVHEVCITKPAFDLTAGYIRQQARDLDEDYYRTLWQHYYDAINIIERKNHRQMKAFMPKRYWKYLPEKQPRKNLDS